jgi:hypothetical protein
VHVEGGLVGEVLRASAFAHAVGVSKVDVEGEEVASDGGIERRGSVEEELALVEPQGLLDVVEDQQFGQLELDAGLLLPPLLASPLGPQALGPSGCISFYIPILVLSQPLPLEISIILS